MSGIVLDLQQEALSSSSDILSLLRKAYLIARKLNLKDFEAWVNSELNGYEVARDVPIPSYRHLHGAVEALNPMRGWIPVVLNKTESTLNTHDARESISSLLDVYNKSGKDYAVVEFSDSMNAYLYKHGSAPFPTKYRLKISTNQLFNIIESVRTSILEWSITLEENGIIGEGLQFSESEKEIATTNPVVNNYVTNIFGNANNSQFQQGTTNSEQAQ